MTSKRRKKHKPEEIVAKLRDAATIEAPALLKQCPTPPRSPACGPRGGA